MVGPLIYSISTDAVAPARVLADFAKTNEKLVLRAGSYGGKVLDKAGVQALASVPSREVLLAQLLGVMQSPISGFALYSAWNWVLSSLSQMFAGTAEAWMWTQ